MRFAAPNIIRIVREPLPEYLRYICPTEQLTQARQFADTRVEATRTDGVAFPSQAVIVGTPWHPVEKMASARISAGI
jgi:hypothetical protein